MTAIIHIMYIGISIVKSINILIVDIINVNDCLLPIAYCLSNDCFSLNRSSALLSVESGDFQYKYWRPFILYLGNFSADDDGSGRLRIVSKQ